MIDLQILNKVLNTQDIGIIKNNDLTEDYFIGYEREYRYLVRFYDKYKKVPDTATFLNKFKDFELMDVHESNKYLLDAIFEEYLYGQGARVVNQMAEYLKEDANEAVEYLMSELPNLQVRQKFDATDIISGAKERYQEYIDKSKAPDGWAIPTGFDELDKVIHGLQRGEEFAVLFARTSHGKSWVLGAILKNAWLLGNRVGYVSPEMSASKLGYRFDTLFKHFSNRSLVRGYDQAGYKKYIDELSKMETPFYVATPQDFGKRITISKLRNFVKDKQLDMLAVDGITYLSDERYRKGDNKTIMLTNISEDLMELSNELKIPIVVVVQSNRGGVKDKETEGTPDIENIRDSDGISHNATKIISIRKHKGGALEFGIKKHRDGEDNAKLMYDWKIDTGEFVYIPGEDDNIDDYIDDEDIPMHGKGTKKSNYGDGKDAF